jgi:enoyl-CoA hydratase
VTVLLVERADGVAQLTLNRPEALNALNLELRQALEHTFRALQKEGDVRVVILTGAGRAFSAGVDLKELGAATSMDRSGAAETSMLAAIRDFDGPIVGAINGHAITGGFELALACDVLVASRSAVFADTHARVGILPGWGLSQKLPRLIGISRAKELSFTGNFLPAEQALAWGLVNHVVEQGDLLTTCRQLATDMLSCEPRTLRAYKRMIDDGFATSFGEGMKMESKRSIEHMAGVTPESVAERRAGIQQRGRAQQRGPR